jgi:hypothetical protein
MLLYKSKTREKISICKNLIYKNSLPWNANYKFCNRFIRTTRFIRDSFKNVRLQRILTFFETKESEKL